MYCPCCGFKINEPTSFCRSCGADIGTICDIMEGRIPSAVATKLSVKKVKTASAAERSTFDSAASRRS
jgi:hypothetical protein